MSSPGPATTAPYDDLLREAVLVHREQERRRRFPVRVHVGLPGQHTETWEDSPDDDHGLRTDLVGAMLQRTRLLGRTRLVWLTRPGELQPHDADVRWAAAVRSAHAELDLPPRFAVVTRHGWYDPHTGEVRAWVRLRRPPAVPRPRPGA